MPIVLSEYIRQNFYTHFCVGSLPHKDPGAALDFIMRRPWIIPFWPELPAVSRQELMLPRALRALENEWNGYRKDEASGLYALKSFLDKNGRAPLLKCQLPGPLTIVQAMPGRGDWSEKLKVAVKACLKQVYWQWEFLRDSAAALLFVFDEPFFGFSEKHEQQILEAYTYLYVRTTELGCSAGIHTCAALEAALFSLPMDLYSFDGLKTALESGSALCEALRAVIQRKAVLACGVFPACCRTEFQAALMAGEQSFRRLSALLKPVSGGQLLLSAACGHAATDESWLQALYDYKLKEA